MKDKQQGSSNQSEGILEDSSSYNMQDNTTNCSDELSGKHTSYKQPKSGFRTNSRFIWDSKFSQSAIVNILETNFESMKVQIHLGNYKMIANVIFTKIKQQDLFYGSLLGAGVFGKVYPLNYQNFQYAIKVIRTKARSWEWGALEFYKEYFLYCMADQFGIGPEIYSLFGYDIVLLKNAGFFVMEKCVKKMSYKSNELKIELTSALNILHSNHIVHLDLKPQNISFSQIKHKHVFLDFGLSKIIKEEIHQKTMTRFLGTLAYCSDEMKKCYILQKGLLVNLYENDKFCLSKTLDEMILTFESKETVNGQSNISFGNNNQKTVLIENIVLVLNLKFHMFKANAPQILSCMRKCLNLPRTCYEICKYKEIKDVNENNSQFKQLLQKFKNFVFSNQIKTYDIDSQILKFFNESGLQQIFQDVIPIKQISNVNQIQFKKLMDSLEWVIKIFHVLNPLEKNHLKCLSMSSLRNKIISKIYQLPQNTNKNTQFPNFICFKSEYAVHFFYDKLKNLKNVKFLIALRIMFLATMAKLDEELIKRMEGEILFLIEDESERMLKIIEFGLFWALTNSIFPYEHPSLFQHISNIKQKSNQERSEYEQNVFELFQKVFSKQNAYYFLYSQPSQFQEAQKLINNIFFMTSQLRYHQLLTDIINFCSEIGRHQLRETKIYQKQLSLTLVVYICVNKPDYLQSLSDSKWKYFEQTYIKFEREHFKKKKDPNYYCNYQNFIHVVSIIKLKQRVVNKFLPCIQQSRKKTYELAQCFFHQNFLNFSSNKDIYRFLCICSTILSLIEEILQKISFNENSPMVKVKERIKSNYFKIREKWENTQMFTFFQIKSFSVLYRLAKSEQEKDRAKQNFVLTLKNGTFGRKQLWVLSTTFQELKYHFYLNKDALLIKIFLSNCDKLIISKPLDYSRQIMNLNLLSIVFMVKKEAGLSKQCFNNIFWILMNLRGSVFDKIFSPFLLKAYDMLFLGSPKNFLVECFDKAKKMIQTIHVQFFMFYLCLLGEMNEEHIKMMFFRVLRSVQKMKRVYQLIPIQLYGTAMTLELFKNKKQHRLFLKKLKDFCLDAFVSLSLSIIQSIQNKQVKSFLILKNQKMFQ